MTKELTLSQMDSDIEELFESAIDSDVGNMNEWLDSIHTARSNRRWKSQTKFLARKKDAERTWGNDPKNLVRLKNTPHFCNTCCNQHWLMKKYGFTNKTSIQKQINSTDDQLKEYYHEQ